MKKTFLAITALAAMLFAGCTSSDELTTLESIKTADNTPTPVQFGTYMGRIQSTTRTVGGATGDNTTATLQAATHGFGVIAYAKGGGATSCYTSTSWNPSAPNFMYNTKVTYSSDHWTYSPLRYWPNDFSNSNVDNKEATDENTNATGSASAGKVIFFAYAPYVDLVSGGGNDYSGVTASTTHTTYSAFDVYNSTTQADEGIVAVTRNDYTGQPEVKYVLQSTNPSAAVDLLWGTRASTTNYYLADKTQDAGSAAKNYNIDLTKQNIQETVDFNFKHALAKIGGHVSETSASAGDQKTGIQVVLDIDNINTGAPSSAISGGTKNDETLVTIDEIKIRDLKTYSDEISGSLTSDLAKSGWFNLATGVWNNVSTPGGIYSSQVDKADVVGTEGWEINTDIKEPSTAPTWSTQWSITGVTTTPKDVYTAGSTVPGCLLIPDASNAQTLVVTITYTVRTYDAKLAVQAGESAPCTKISQTITNRVSIPAGSLQSNKYYKLLMHLGLTSVKFSAVVDDWDSATNGGQGGNDNDSNAHDKDVYLPSNTITNPS